MEELGPYMRGRRSYFGFCETPEVVDRLSPNTVHLTILTRALKLIRRVRPF